jgi:hypothetical protein
MAEKKKQREIKWGELEPKVPDNPKVFVLDKEVNIPPKKKKEPEEKRYFFNKGGMVKGKGKGQNRDYCK